MGRKTLKGIWRIEGRDCKSIHTCSIQKGRKIQSGNKYIKTCHWRSSILETRRKMETNCIFIKDNTSSWMKLWDIWQKRTLGHSGGSNKIETIPIKHHWKVWNLNRSQKSQVLQRTTQTQWMTSKMVSQATRLWFHFIIHSRENKHKSRHSVKN